MTKTTEQVLAELALAIHDKLPFNYAEIEAMTAPYLPKPKTDRLTVAARDCWAVHDVVGYMSTNNGVAAIRAIIAREVAAAEPSDEVLRKFENAASLFSQLRTTVAARFEGLCERELWLSINAAFDKLEAARAALKGEGA